MTELLLSPHSESPLTHVFATASSKRDDPIRKTVAFCQQAQRRQKTLPVEEPGGSEDHQSETNVKDTTAKSI